MMHTIFEVLTLSGVVRQNHVEGRYNMGLSDFSKGSQPPEESLISTMPISAAQLSRPGMIHGGS